MAPSDERGYEEEEEKEEVKIVDRHEESVSRPPSPLLLSMPAPVPNNERGEETKGWRKDEEEFMARWDRMTVRKGNGFAQEGGTQRGREEGERGEPEHDNNEGEKFLPPCGYNYLRRERKRERA